LIKTISQQFHIPADHPCFAGHFPGDPIVPAVVLLDYVRKLLQQWQPGSQIITISMAKFHHPLKPNQEFTIKLIENKPLSIKFECFLKNEKIATGHFEIMVKA
jgi:3-hydroxyacyl-[acyl-carrier-protein] dehydratase